MDRKIIKLVQDAIELGYEIRRNHELNDGSIDQTVVEKPAVQDFEPIQDLNLIDQDIDTQLKDLQEIPYDDTLQDDNTLDEPVKEYIPDTSVKPTKENVEDAKKKLME